MNCLNCINCNKTSSSLIKGLCKSCHTKVWRQNNREKALTYSRNSYKKHRDQRIKDALFYARLNPEVKKKAAIKFWSQIDESTIKKYRKVKSKWKNRKYKSDPIFKIKHNLRNRLNIAIKSNQKTGSAIKDLGCSVQELKKYLESKFQPGMSWDNYGEWEIDHIKPLSSFNLSNREELLKACHYTNLQPLWWKDNLLKRDKVNLCQ